ncbi:conserved hypothetical protein [Vibrio crassostreae]|nr:conserved hypothetical protein [Vibrio crassostreae]CAK2319814.1 conserved hypothetical protein [Vibrio crassostreae]
MDDTKKEPLFVVRGMKMDSDGKPKLGECARTLGVRVPKDISPDTDGVIRDGIHGMSVSPIPVFNLPKHRRPQEWGGIGKDPVFGIDESLLIKFDLRFLMDPKKDSHGYIAPVGEMSYTDYVANLHATKPLWEYVKPENNNDENSQSE